ncbi:hypothetical protein GCM10009764_50140 [Nocardia ninae]|uniref:Uncharacterized protein n=1 Tax=Nocardia ninae NBRC 108245 TaxID=1210091 RepID=A0A511MC58_9NOCA|nr:hypothetical protein NN4_25900 [Nocardia ninae NBRC 108245]
MVPDASAVAMPGSDGKVATAPTIAAAASAATTIPATARGRNDRTAVCCFGFGWSSSAE